MALDCNISIIYTETTMRMSHLFISISQPSPSKCNRVWIRTRWRVTSCKTKQGQVDPLPNIRFPHFFRNEIQGLFKEKITFFKHYRIIIWHIVNALFGDEITCRTPNCNIHGSLDPGLGSIPELELELIPIPIPGIGIEKELNKRNWNW